MPVHVDDRIVVRDRPWRVRKATEVEGEQWLVSLEALDGDLPESLEVLVPLEPYEHLPSERLAFDLSGFDSLAAWANAHRILAATLVHDTAQVVGARFGRVTLEAYQSLLQN